MRDPTYVREEIDANPIWKAAFLLSEHLNDNAPIGWSRFIPAIKGLDRAGLLSKGSDRLPGYLLTRAEVQSKFDRLSFAEGLIRQLPPSHDGRNTWLLNYGQGEEALNLRHLRNINWAEETQSAETISSTKPTFTE